MVDRLYAANLAYTTLNGALAQSATSMTVADPGGFPGNTEVPFLVTINSEIIKVNEVDGSNFKQLERGYEGTTDTGHADTDQVSMRVTAGTINNVYDYIEDYAAAKNHNLVNTTHHPVTGLTTGHFFKATGATAYAFEEHGLGASDVSAVPAAGGAMSGNLDMAGNQVQSPELKTYSETRTSSTSTTINVADGNVHVRTRTGSTTWTFTNPPANNKAYSFTLILHGSGNTMTWPSSVKWPGGDKPEMTGTSVLTFATVDQGSNWYGFLAGSDMK